MIRNALARTVLVLATVAATGLAAPALVDATPAEPVPAVAIARGIGYSVQVDGLSITYTATDVPRVPLVGSLTLPGSCTTAVVDAVRAAPVVGPVLLDYLVGNPDIDVLALLRELGDAGAITAIQPLQGANRDNVVSGTFQDIPRGVYAVVSICNLNSDLLGAAGALVLGPTWGSGSSDGGGSSIGSSAGS